MFRPVSRCVRGSGLGWCVYPTRGDSARTGRALWRHKNGEYAAVTRGRPAFQRHEAHAEGSDTTPTQKHRKSAVCRREQRVRRRRAPTLRKPFFCRNKPRVGLFRHSHSGRRVVIPPPTQKCQKSTVCRREQRVRRRRAPTLRKPFFCRNKPRAGLFRHRQSGQRIVIPPPHRNAEKMQNGSFYHRPQQGSRRNPAKRFRWEEGGAAE